MTLESAESKVSALMESLLESADCCRVAACILNNYTTFERDDAAAFFAALDDSVHAELCSRAEDQEERP